MDNARPPLPNRRPGGQFCGRTRRELLWEAGGGFASVALTALLGGDGFLSRQAVAADGSSRFKSPMAPKQPPHPGKAKSVIFLFMYGGPSQVDTFDYKPRLYGLDGKTIHGQDVRPRRQEERGPGRRAEVGFSASTASAASGSPTSSRTWPPASTTSRSFIRCMPTRRFTARPC